MIDYKWNVLSKSNNAQNILLDILKWKNISKDKIREFIDFKMEPHNPYLLTNMDKAVVRINQAITNNEKICIIGDYDADGVTSTSVLYIGLRSKFANVIWKIPNRFKDGYGINKRLIDVAIEENCSLIITVDNGIAAKEQIEYAKSKGLDVIVTDHHQLINGIPTEITINPQMDDNYPFKCICGCMVAFKLIMALIPNIEVENEDLYEELLSITTIGTIADVMELVDENRFYVKQGLKYLSKPKNIGLLALVQRLNLYEKDLSSDDIGFGIGPCINAAGRLESADIAVNLILSDDSVEADKLAEKIIKLNDKRKDLQAQFVNQLQVDEKDNFIVIHADGIGHGILGIIAGKVAEKYQKPCFILGGNEENNKLSGSGRSVYTYNINQCVQDNNDIASGGGHAAACGVKLKFEDLEEFKDRCNKHFSTWLQNANINDLTPILDVACEINIDLITERLINNISKLKPYGNGNEEPIFVSRKLNVESYKIVGKNSNVIQMTLTKNWSTIKSVGFNDIKEKYEELGFPNEIDVLYSIGLNEWPKGMFNPQLTIKDIKKSE